MKTLILNCVAALGAVALAPALASPQLAQKSACASCHAVDRKLVGPAYAEVMKRYAGQADAVAVLSKSIKAGSAGKWGPVPMPAQPKLSEADAKTLATWIMGGAK